MTTSFDLPRVRALVLRIAQRSGAEVPPVATEPAATAPPLPTDGRPAEPGSSVGAGLRAERLRRGLTLDDCETQLHIRAKFLAALEGDRDDELPEPAYARIFARSYATLLGLDAVALTRELDRRAGDTRWREHETVAPEPVAVGCVGTLIELVAASSESRRARAWWIAVTVAVALSVLAWLGYRVEARPATPTITPTTLGPANLAPPPPAPAPPTGTAPRPLPARIAAAPREAGRLPDHPLTI